MKIAYRIIEATKDGNVNKLMQDIRDKVEPDLIKAFTNGYLDKAKEQVKLIKDKGITNTTKWDYENKYNKLDMLSLIDTGSPSAFINPDDAKIHKDADKKAEKMAKSQVSGILAKFETKGYDKLSKIVDRVGAPDKMDFTTSISGNTLQSDIKVSWKSGAKFTFRTQIVYGITDGGKWFAKYPGTFHDAVTGDGTKIKKASLAKMEKEFNV
jgi:hypothetical protein